ncbi:MAG: toxin-antitoxin system HicB family antitoxin [Gemmatimonadetes bacterium]|nr:toxin-antitoxin system HicB family antitoxin [Gemmatimonadota bacterium]MDE2678701.1 toxin-antitoxin system HicB family antitoxin [Gemmatimonadota bacterium]MXX33395.1 toxin-antitoxin system HicB family antitoxin [Gemmatimonadota bacterium]MYD12603.1 toxin-antitoxin system HicB family antitoxin [Gemmatimonadota bacterium]MYI67134.1 toxin-antitoxin system HicB family antitoxin [Gemmatimonadota bacterium]
MPNDTINDPRQRPPSGRFVVRIDPALHASLRERARSEDISLNRYCARELGSPSSELPQPASEAVGRAHAILGESLLGVVAFGSWARGEPSWESDLDMLLIAGDGVPISRNLYRQWDDGPALKWDGHVVEPHFVHLLADGETPSGLWAEVAMDGHVLFERRLAVSRTLAGVRRRILEERLSHRVAHGNPYWVRES